LLHNGLVAIPTIFISSTFYDLKYVRESLKRFVDQMGYNPVLSEDGTIFFDPATTAADSCLKEISNVDLFVLIIGGRYGSLLSKQEHSVTNGEFRAAVARNVPVFALIEQGTYNDYQLYKANRNQPEVLSKISFPNADDVRIFRFIEEVQARSVNNALVGFAAASEIERYLRLQWAGLMHGFLTRAAQANQVTDTLTVLTSMNERVELIASQILRAVGKPIDRTYVSLLELMMKTTVVSDLRFIGTKPRPGDICEHNDIQSFVTSQGKILVEDSQEDMDDEGHSPNSISGSGQASRYRLELMSNQYTELRRELLQVLNADATTPDQIFEYEKTL